MTDIADLALEVRVGARLDPDSWRRFPEKVPIDPGARTFDKRGREIENGDPILFAAAGSFQGVFLGRFLGRDPSTGRMIAQVDPAEPRAGERTAILAASTLRARAEDIRAELRRSIARDLREMAGHPL
jgi:hypothetical protein